MALAENVKRQDQMNQGKTRDLQLNYRKEYAQEKFGPYLKNRASYYQKSSFFLLSVYTFAIILLRRPIPGQSSQRDQI